MKRPAKDWPYDQPTVTCSTCNGSGMNRRRADEYAGSKQPTTTDGANAQTLGLVCRECEGRGRKLANQNLANPDWPRVSA